MSGTAYEVRPCTAAQIAEAKRLGITMDGYYTRYEVAEQLIAKRRAALAREARIAAAKAQQEAKPAPVLLDAWEKGAAMLQGEAGHCYSVEMGARTFDFVVCRPGERTVLNPDGLTVRYDVCLDASDTAYGCDCPDNNRRGHERPCKHMLCARVWAWELAQESEGDYTEWLERIGALELRQAHEARKGEQG